MLAQPTLALRTENTAHLRSLSWQKSLWGMCQGSKPCSTSGWALSCLSKHDRSWTTDTSLLTAAGRVCEHAYRLRDKRLTPCLSIYLDHRRKVFQLTRNASSAMDQHQLPGASERRTHVSMLVPFHERGSWHGVPFTEFSPMPCSQ